MTRPAKGCSLLFQWVSSTSTHWSAYCASICSSEDTPWGKRAALFFLAILLDPLSPPCSGKELLAAYSGSRYGYIKLRPETDEITTTQLREEYPVALWCKHVELIARWASVLAQPFVQPLEMLDGKFVLFHVLRRRVTYLFVPLNLDNENVVALLDEEVWAEFAALGVFAFLPGILDRVEADWRILQPGVHDLCVVPLAERTHESALRHGIRNDQVSRCLEVTVITNLLPA